MRKTVLWQTPHVRASLSALLALAAIVFVFGCGGGGGGGGGTSGGVTNGGNNGSTPPGQNPTLPFVSGRIRDTSNPSQGVVGAKVVLFGNNVPNITVTVTSKDGSFTIANVPKAYTAFTVTSPDTSVWYNYALYATKQYDTLNCRLPLPALNAGNNKVTDVLLYSANNNPPPPPLANGCP